MLTETQRRPAESQETQSENTLLVAMKQFPVTDLYLNFAERYFFFISPLFIFNRRHLRQAAANLVVACRVRAAKIVETTSPRPFQRDSFAFRRRSSLVLVVTARLLFYFHR